MKKNCDVITARRHDELLSVINSIPINDKYIIHFTKTNHYYEVFALLFLNESIYDLLAVVSECVVAYMHPTAACLRVSFPYQLVEW